MIVSKTPLRISFAGGGTDLPSFYRFNDYGAVLSVSINKYIYVTVKKHTPFFGERLRLNYSETELLDRLDDIKNPIIRECLRFLEIDERIYISTVADVPGSSGLGSSSSFCVGLLNALYRYKGEAVSAGRLAEEAAYIEIDILKRPIGKQDHYATAFGGLNFIRFNADESVTIRPITPKNETLGKLFNALISFWTGISRPAESILKEQDEKNCKNGGMLIRLREQAEELMSLIYYDNLSVDGFGKILDEGWQLKRKLASKVSNPTIDRFYAIAIKNGAIGGKISGAGGGGFLNIIAHKADHEQINEALKTEGLMPCKFNMDSAGTTVTQLD
jgi:D-glycero-alpha-D-manno-heptose-7-phosphate kinase